MGYIIALHAGDEISQHGNPTKNTARYTFLCAGYSTSFAAMAALQAYLAPYVAVGSAILSPWDISLSHKEADNYEATVDYTAPERQEQVQIPVPNFPELTIDAGTETQHVTQGYEVRDAWPPGTPKSYFNGQINVDIDAKGNQKVKGVDVPIANLKISVNYVIPTPANPFALGRFMADAVPGVNSTAWYGFDAGELRFMGGRVTGKLGDQWRMQLAMEASPNVSVPVDFGTPQEPFVEQCFKRGWDYFWIQYESEIIYGINEPRQRAKRAFSHRMFREYDFRIFGLGG